MNASSCATLAGVLGLGIGVAAQDDSRPSPAGDLTAALASADPRTVCWAAQDVRAQGRRQLTPTLQRTFRDWCTRDDDHAAVARAFLLDALVEFDARLPAADLLPWIDDEPGGTTAFVLLLRESRANERELLALFGTRDLDADLGNPSAMRTFVLGSVLCAQRTPGLANSLWQRCRHECRIRVPDPQLTVTLEFERPAKVVPPEGFPAMPRYELALGNPSQDRNLRSLSPDLPGICYRRLGPDDGPTTWALTIRPWAWLATLAGTGHPESELHTIPLGDPKEWQQAVNAACEQTRSERAAILAGLRKNQAMTAAEAKAAAGVPLRIVIVDARTNRSVGLPTIADAEIEVEDGR